MPAGAWFPSHDGFGPFLHATHCCASTRCPCSKEANGTLGCVRPHVAISSKEVIPLLCSALVRPHLECWVQFWAPQYKSGMDILERAQQSAIKMMKGLENLSCEDRLRAGAVQPREEKAAGRSESSLSVSKAAVKGRGQTL